MRPQRIVRLNAEELGRLVSAAQRDGGRAVDTLLWVIRPRLLEYFTRRIAPDEADDLAQLALLRVVKALPRIESIRASAFVATVAQNLLRTAQRRFARDAQRFIYGDAIDRIESALRADDKAEHHEFLDAIRVVSTKSLPNELRDVIHALLRGQSYAEIAAIQGVRQVTVRTRLLRARAILREELSQYRSASHDALTEPSGSHRSREQRASQNEEGVEEVWSLKGTHQKDHRRER